MKKIPLDELQEKARIMTRQSLVECLFPEDFKDDELFLEVKFEENERRFELYRYGGSTPDKDFLIAETTLNIYTGEGTVKTFLPGKESQE